MFDFIGWKYYYLKTNYTLSFIIVSGSHHGLNRRMLPRLVVAFAADFMYAYSRLGPPHYLSHKRISCESRAVCVLKWRLIGKSKILLRTTL